jgi:hypothetical protein
MKSGPDEAASNNCCTTLRASVNPTEGRNDGWPRTKTPGDPGFVFAAHNVHDPSCGWPPRLRTTADPVLYYGYFENCYVRQFVLASTGRSGPVRSGMATSAGKSRSRSPSSCWTRPSTPPKGSPRGSWASGAPRYRSAGDRLGAGAGASHRPERNGRGDLTDREICRPAPRSRSSPRVAEAAYATEGERRVRAEAGPAVRLSAYSPPHEGTGVCGRRGLSELGPYLFPGELVKLIPSRPSMHTGRVGTSADDDAGAWFGEAPRGGRRRPCR